MKQGTTWSVLVACCAALLAGLIIPRPLGCETIGSETADAVVADHILDGKEFNGFTGEKGKKGHHEDMLIFRDGMFTSSACLPYGFGSGPYTAIAQGDAVKFKAETISPTLGKMEWQGTIIDNTLEVTYTWTKKRWLWTTYREYWFKGRLVE